LVRGLIDRLRRTPAGPPGNTGERVVPERSGEGLARANLVRHRAAYLHARKQFREARRVLDVGCGTGYGSAMMATPDREVVGVDTSGEAVEWAKTTYRAENASFFVMPATELRFPDNSFDAVCSIQSIEHFDDVEVFLSEVVRVLRPGGVLAVATPNRLTYSPDGKINPFHTREYDARELEQLLAGYFEEIRVTGLHAGLDLALAPGVTDHFHEYGARVEALREALHEAPENVRRFVEEWLVEDGFESFNFGAVGLHSFPVSPKSIDTSLDLLSTGSGPR
jgi:ubiquinone/menaquinone biosynthesis C-methylase UbiE